MDIETTAKHKFLESSNMTFQAVFDFAYKKLIPVLQGLAKELGEDHFLEALKKVSFECALKAAQDKHTNYRVTILQPSSTQGANPVTLGNTF